MAYIETTAFLVGKNISWWHPRSLTPPDPLLHFTCKSTSKPHSFAGDQIQLPKNSGWHIGNGIILVSFRFGF